MKMIDTSDKSRIAGHLTIKTFKDGVEVRCIEKVPNKVVNSSGYGRNLVTRQLGGDTTYPLAIDSASLGTSSTTAIDAQTNLVTPTVTGITITNRVAVGDVLTVDVFVPDASLPNSTYREYGLFCTARMFARIVIASGYTKATGEDTLFTYTLTLS